MILFLCVPELVFVVLVLTNWRIDIVFILALLIGVEGFVQVPLTWVLLAVLWRYKSAPRRKKLECTIALIFATVVHLKLWWIALTFKT